MITEENLDSDCREVHYVSENGRVEGLILNKTPIEEVRRSRPKSAKGDRRTASRDGRLSVTTGELTYRRTFDIESINEKGVQDLFSDILYDSEENPDPDEYKDDFEDVDEENNWSDDSPMPYTLSASSRASRADNYQYHQSRAGPGPQPGHYPVPESPAIVSGVKYNEWQRNSGLRVLRKVLDRQKLLEFEAVNVGSSRGGGGGRRHEKLYLPQEEAQQLQSLRMRKRPGKLQPLSSEASLQEEAGRKLSQSIMARVSTASALGPATMKGV